MERARDLKDPSRTKLLVFLGWRVWAGAVEQRAQIIHIDEEVRRHGDQIEAEHAPAAAGVHGEAGVADLGPALVQADHDPGGALRAWGGRGRGLVAAGAVAAVHAGQ